MTAAQAWSVSHPGKEHLRNVYLRDDVLGSAPLRNPMSTKDVRLSPVSAFTGIVAHTAFPAQRNSMMEPRLVRSNVGVPSAPRTTPVLSVAT